MHRVVCPSFASLAVTAATVLAQAPALRQPPGHADFGLPRPAANWSTYAQDGAHVCNRIWQAIYLARCVPTEVGAALPREHDDARTFFEPGWYFAKRAGVEADGRLFGGDGRQLPVEGFDEQASRQLRTWLDAVDGEVAAELRARPRAAVWFQHDLLRLVRRLVDTGQNAELIAPLRQCAQRIALPAGVLQGPAVRTVTVDDVAAALPEFDPARAVEIERRSSRLFDAEWVQLWSSVFVQLPDRDREATARWLAAGAARDALPIGTVAVLLQGVVAVDEGGQPRATDLVIEVRLQRLSNREPLASDNPTTTRDGVDFAMWSLERSTVRDLGATADAVPFAAFRTIDMESQELFRDYGTRKHTTYAAQCALCHRRSNSPDEPLAGFSALRVSSQPRPVTDPGERRRRAEAEMARFLTEARAR